MRAFLLYHATVGEVALVAAQTEGEARALLARETGWADYAATATAQTILDGAGTEDDVNVRKEVIPDAIKNSAVYPVGYVDISA